LLWHFSYVLPTALSFHLDPLRTLVSAVRAFGMGLEYRDLV
jgi:hypothetical protein